MSNIEDRLKFILRSDVIVNGDIEERLVAMSQVNEAVKALIALRAEVERLKCCGNCIHRADDLDCERIYYFSAHRCEKRWQSDNLTAEQRRK